MARRSTLGVILFKPGVEPRPGFEPGTDPGFQQRSGIGGGRSFIVNIRSKPNSLILFLFFITSLLAVRLDTWSEAPRGIVDCRMEEPIEGELLSSIARLAEKQPFGRYRKLFWIHLFSDELCVRDPNENTTSSDRI